MKKIQIVTNIFRREQGVTAFSRNPSKRTFCQKDGFCLCYVFVTQQTFFERRGTCEKLGTLVAAAAAAAAAAAEAAAAAAAVELEQQEGEEEERGG